MSLARLCSRIYAISEGVRRVLIGQITARAAGMAWYASAIIGLQRELYRSNKGASVGKAIRLTCSVKELRRCPGV